jgi:methionyl aminopeptidase
MSIESSDDFDGVREAGRVTTATLDALVQHARAGMTTGDLDAMAAGVLARHGARSAPKLVYGFPGTVLISINDEIVHGIPGRRQLKDGDLVSLDVTIEKDGYVADAARSVVIGQAAPEARRLVATAELALRKALDVARAGTRVNEIGRAVQREVRRQGFAVVRGLCGHGVGRTIHEPPEVPNEYVASQQDVLTEGLVLTIEPMVSAGSSRVVQAPDLWTLRTSDGSLAAHCEHTIVITTGTALILAA